MLLGGSASWQDTVGAANKIATARNGPANGINPALAAHGRARAHAEHAEVVEQAIGHLRLFIAPVGFVKARTLLSWLITVKARLISIMHR